MKYEKWTFVVIPNIKQLEWKSPVLQTIYMWICYYSNQDWLCFPSQKTLAKNVWVSNNTLKTYLKELEKLWLLCRERRYKDNQEITSMYQVLIGVSTIDIGVGQPLGEGVSTIEGGVGQPLPTELNVSLTKSNELNLSKDKETGVSVVRVDKSDKDINELLFLIKREVENQWKIYKAWKNERQRARNILTWKDYWEVCERAWMDRVHFTLNIIKVADKLDVWRNVVNNAETVYKHYAQVYNTAKGKKEEMIEKKPWLARC